MSACVLKTRRSHVAGDRQMTLTDRFSTSSCDQLSDEELEAAGLMILDTLSFQSMPRVTSHAGHFHSSKKSRDVGGAPTLRGATFRKGHAADTLGDGD